MGSAVQGILLALLASSAAAQEPPLPDGAISRLRVAAADGRPSSVTTLAMSPDGKTLAAGSLDKTVTVWTLAAPEKPLKLPPEEYFPRSLVFAPDGKLLYWSSSYGGILALDLGSGKIRLLADSRHSDSDALSLSPDGKTFATTDKDRNLYLWDAAGDKARSRVIAGRPGVNPEDGAYVTMMGRLDTQRSTAFTPDGKGIAWGWDDGSIRLCDIDSRAQLKKFPGHNSWRLAHSMAFSADGKLLASAGYDHCVKIWEVTGGKQILEHESRGDIRGLSFSPDGKRLAWGEDRGTLRLLEIGARSPVGELRGPPAAVTSLVFTPDGKTLISGDAGGSILFWDLAVAGRKRAETRDEKPVSEGTLLYTIDPSSVFHDVVFSGDGSRAAFVIRDVDGDTLVADGMAAGGKWPSINGLVFSPDGRRLACEKSEGPQKCRVYLDGLPGELFSAIWQPVFSPDGKRIAYAANDPKGGTRAVIDGQTGPAYNSVSCLSFSADSQHIAYVAYDPKRQWDVIVRDGKETDITHSRIQQLAVHPDGRSFAYAAFGGDTSWIEHDGHKEGQFQWCGMPCFSLDGKTLAYYGTTGGMSAVVVNGRKVDFKGSSPRSLELSPDGSRWACADHEQVTVDGRPGRKFEQVGRPVFSPDGRKLAHAAGDSGRMRLVVVDGPESEEYSEIWNPRFSADGRKITFGARKGRQLWTRVLALE
jgi:WD40 repeat protein